MAETSSNVPVQNLRVTTDDLNELSEKLGELDQSGLSKEAKALMSAIIAVAADAMTDAAPGVGATDLIEQRDDEPPVATAWLGRPSIRRMFDQTFHPDRGAAGRSPEEDPGADPVIITSPPPPDTPDLQRIIITGPES